MSLEAIVLDFASLTKIVKLLVDRKANIHHRGAGGWNAITIATSSTTHPDILRTLIEGGANLRDSHPETGNTPLHFAVAHNAELAKIRLEFRKSVDSGETQQRWQNPRNESIRGLFRPSRVKLLCKTKA